MKQRLTQLCGGVYCIDGTYKITKENFVLDVFGRVDMNRKLHPVAFMLTSHESREDYEYFYSHLKDICSLLNFFFMCNNKRLATNC